MANRILKKIEILFRRIVISLLEDRRAKTFVYERRKLFTSESKRILLVRHDRIGDLIISIPIIRELRKRLPDAQIDILLSEKNYAAHPPVKQYVNNILVYRKSPASVLSLIRKMKQNRYHVVVDMYDNPSASASIAVRFSGAMYSVGINKENSYAYSHLVQQLDNQEHHIIERTAELLKPFDIDPRESNLSPEYFINDEESEQAFKKLGSPAGKPIGINLAGSNPSKYWGSDNNIELIRRIKENMGYEILLFHTPDYNSEVAEIASGTGIKVAPPAESFHEYAAMLANCGMIITPDTAAVHIAAARQIPCVAFFDVSRQDITGIPWYPYKSPSRTLKTATGSIKDITPTEAYEAILSLIKETGYSA